MTMNDETALARDYLAQLDWKVRGVAKLVGVPETRIRRMLAGITPLDQKLVDWLKVLSEFHAENPPPRLDAIPGKMAETSPAQNPRNRAKSPKTAKTGRKRATDESG
jgi:hypothetical protein